jgi:hypothetical protein
LKGYEGPDLTYVETLLSRGIPIVFRRLIAAQVAGRFRPVPLRLAVGALGTLRRLSLGWARADAGLEAWR